MAKQPYKNCVQPSKVGAPLTTVGMPFTDAEKLPLEAGHVNIEYGTAPKRKPVPIVDHHSITFAQRRRK